MNSLLEYKKVKGVVKIKSSQSSEGNELKDSIDKSKGRASKPKSCKGKKTQTKTQDPELRADTDFKGWYSDLEGFVFDLRPRAS